MVVGDDDPYNPPAARAAYEDALRRSGADWTVRVHGGAAHLHMAAAGYPSEVQSLGGARALFLPDPDGLRVEVTWYPPGVSVVD